jgi:hypothetical protein
MRSTLEIPLAKWMVERHKIFIRKMMGAPWPWTKDPIMQKYKFTNVFRELDKTTVWFDEHYRDEYQSDESVILATIIFRWFNRIETGQRLLSAGLLKKWSSEKAQRVLRDHKPWTTGAYIISSPHGFDKLTGLCQYIDAVWKERKGLVKWIESEQRSIEQTVTKLCSFKGLSGFMAYEIASDLTHTWALKWAPDAMSWANPGPGARRGLNRLHGRELKARVPKSQLIVEMRQLLPLIQKQMLKAFDTSDLPGCGVTMREIEHSLCEFDKYQRVTLGQGRPRSVYRR